MHRRSYTDLFNIILSGLCLGSRRRYRWKQQESSTSFELVLSEGSCLHSSRDQWVLEDVKEVSTAANEVVTTADDAEITTAATTLQISKDDVTLAQTLVEIKAAKLRVRGVIVQEPSKFRTTLSLQSSQLPQAKYKGKRIMVKPEKSLKRKDQITIDEEISKKLKAQMKAKMEEEERIARGKVEANITVVEQ
nr:hypothetical protein [Tanacetum cinerariifolium]